MWKLSYQGNRDPGGLPDGTWIQCKRAFWHLADVIRRASGNTVGCKPETYAVGVKATETDKGTGVQETDTAETGAEGTNPVDTKAVVDFF